MEYYDAIEHNEETPSDVHIHPTISNTENTFSNFGISAEHLFIMSTLFQKAINYSVQDTYATRMQNITHPITIEHSNSNDMKDIPTYVNDMPTSNAVMHILEDQPLDLTTKMVNFRSEQEQHFSPCFNFASDYVSLTPRASTSHILPHVGGTVWTTGSTYHQNLHSIFYNNYKRAFCTLFRNYSASSMTHLRNTTEIVDNSMLAEITGGTIDDRSVNNARCNEKKMLHAMPLNVKSTPFNTRWPRTYRDTFWTKEANRLVQKINAPNRMYPNPSHGHMIKHTSTESNHATPSTHDSSESKPVRRAYTEAELSAAVRAICFGRLGTRRAASVYGIPRSTLRNKICKLNELKRREEERQGGKIIVMSDFLQFLMQQLNERGPIRINNQAPLRRLQSEQLDSDEIRKSDFASTELNRCPTERNIFEHRSGRLGLPASRIASIFQVNCRRNYVNRKAQMTVSRQMRSLDTMVQGIQFRLDKHNSNGVVDSVGAEKGHRNIQKDPALPIKELQTVGSDPSVWPYAETMTEARVSGIVKRCEQNVSSSASRLISSDRIPYSIHDQLQSNKWTD